MPSARPSSTMITGLRSLSIMWIASLTGLAGVELGQRRLDHLGDRLAEDPGVVGEAISRPRSLTVPMKARPSSPETTGTWETPCSRISSRARADLVVAADGEHRAVDAAGADAPHRR